MPQICKPCQHPDRAGIDAAIAAGTPLREIASTNGLTTSSLFRHSQHVHEHRPVRRQRRRQQAAKPSGDPSRPATSRTPKWLGDDLGADPERLLEDVGLLENYVAGLGEPYQGMIVSPPVTDVLITEAGVPGRYVDWFATIRDERGLDDDEPYTLRR